MTRALQASHVALNEEGQGEWIASVSLVDLWHKGNFRYVDLLVSSVSFDSFKSLVKFSWRIVLVQVNVLNGLSTVLRDASDGLTESLLEKLRSVVGCCTHTCVDCRFGIGFGPLVHAELSHFIT